MKVLLFPVTDNSCRLDVIFKNGYTPTSTHMYVYILFFSKQKGFMLYIMFSNLPNFHLEKPVEHDSLSR